MKIQQNILYLITMLFLFVSFSSSSFANTTSNSGILFTEKEQGVRNDKLIQGNKNCSTSNSDKVNLVLPQTGEKNGNVILLGLIYIMFSLLMKTV